MLAANLFHLGKDRFAEPNPQFMRLMSKADIRECRRWAEEIVQPFARRLVQEAKERRKAKAAAQPQS
jgi:hypothetical protein